MNFSESGIFSASHSHNQEAKALKNSGFLSPSLAAFPSGLLELWRVFEFEIFHHTFYKTEKT